MTAQERTVIESLTQSFHELREEVHMHIQHTDDTFRMFQKVCDERHGIRPGRLSNLEKHDRDTAIEVAQNTITRKTLITVAGWAVALLAVIVNIILNLT